MRLAARGRRETETGEAAIADPALVQALRRQALEVHVEAGLLAVALTGIGVLLPLS